MIEIITFVVGWILGLAVFWAVYVPLSSYVRCRKREEFTKWYEANKPKPIYNENGEKIWTPETGCCGPATWIKC